MKDPVPGEQAYWWRERVEIVREFKPFGRSLDVSEWLIRTKEGNVFIVRAAELKR